MNKYYLASHDVKTNFSNIAKIRQLQSNLVIANQDESILSECMKELEGFIQKLRYEAISEAKEIDYSYISKHIDKIEANLLFNQSIDNSVHIECINSILSDWLKKYNVMFTKYKFFKEKIATPLLPNFYEYFGESILKNIQLNITFPFATKYHIYSDDIYSSVIRLVKNIDTSSVLLYLNHESNLYDGDIDKILCSLSATPYLDYPTAYLIHRGKRMDLNINDTCMNFTIDNPKIKLKYKDNPIYISEKCLLENQFLNSPPCPLLDLTIEIYGDLIFTTWKY